MYFLYWESRPKYIDVSSCTHGRVHFYPINYSRIRIFLPLISPVSKSWIMKTKGYWLNKKGHTLRHIQPQLHVSKENSSK